MRKRLIIGVLSVLAILSSIPGSIAQTVVFDDEITWEWPPEDNIHGGYGFYWYHRLDGITMPDYGEMSQEDWTSPVNYYYGQFRMRFEVLEQPTDKPFRVQFGIWQDHHKGEAYPLTVCSRKDISRGAVWEGSIGSPTTWYNKEPEDKVDFSRPGDFFRMGLVLWNPDPLCIPQGTDWDPNGCPEHAEKFFPMRARVTITAYPANMTYPPSYSVDYENEQTGEQVPGGDQWSEDSATWTDGNDDFLGLTPGVDLYFRRKEDHAKVQVVDVKERPATPAYTIDFMNESTSEPVSDSTWYAARSDMNGAHEGTGDPVALLPGSTIYFQTKPTYISFRSEIQALTVPPRPDPPAYTIDYWNEQTYEFVPVTEEYATTPDMNVAIQGTGATVQVTPGETLYFRKMPTGASFASDIHVLNPPLRPVFTTDEGDTTEHNPFLASVIFFQGATNLTNPGITAINAAVKELQLISALESSTLYQATVSPVSAGTVTLQVLANAVDEGNFASGNFHIHYRWGTGIQVAGGSEQMAVWPNPTAGKVRVSSTLLEEPGTWIGIYSATGKLLIPGLPVPGNREAELNLERLDRGIYFLKLHSPSGNLTGKVILTGQ